MIPLPHRLSSVRSLGKETGIVWTFTKGYRWAVPILVALGFAASLAETVGISLIVLFLYAVIGTASNASAGGGLLAQIFDAGLAVAGDNRAVLALLILGLVALRAILNLVYALFTTHIKNAISERTRNAVYARYLEVPYGYLRGREQGALVNMLANESWSIADAFYFLTRLATNLCAIAVFSAFLGPKPNKSVAV
jgi:subfamily B ATP-binding cassette protein MsbA